MAFVKFVSQRLRKGALSRLKIGDNLIIPHKDFERLSATIYQFKRRNPGTEFEYLECVNGYVVKRIA